MYSIELEPPRTSPPKVAPLSLSEVRPKYTSVASGWFTYRSRSLEEFQRRPIANGTLPTARRRRLTAEGELTVLTSVSQ